MKLSKTNFTVNGMQCDGCADSVSKAITDLKGVRSAEVSLDNEQATVSYDEEQTGFTQMKKAVENAGYQAEQQ